jgi:hypothetical protein
MAGCILIDSLFSTSTVLSASTTDPSDTAFNVLNVIDLRPYTFWRAGTSTGTKYITIDTGQTTSVADGFAIVGHNLSSASSVIAVQHSSDNFGTIATASTITPTDNKAFGALFSSAVNRYWRIAIPQPTTVKPFIGVVMLGEKLTMPRGEGRTINPEAHTALNEGADSKSLQPLGVIQRGKQRRLSVNINGLQSTWIANSFVPLWDTHLSFSKPFIWHWDTALSSACYYMQINPSAANYVSPYLDNTNFRSLTMNMIGRKEDT